MRLSSLNSAPSADLGLLLLRATTGVIAAAHGGQKLVVYGIDGVSGAFAQMGIPMAGIAGPTTGLVELVAGVALLVGLFTRISGFALALTMLGAIGFVHIKGGFFAPTGIEFPLSVLGATSALAVAGAGRYSLDALLARRRAPVAGATPALRPLPQVA